MKTLFSELAEKIPNEDGVVKAFELAPEGIITEIYPMQGKFRGSWTGCTGEHERKKDAALAKETGGVYTWRPLSVKAGRNRSITFLNRFIESMIPRE